MSKFNVLLDKDGNPTAAGYCVFKPDTDAGETVKEYADADKDVLAAIKARPKAMSDTCKALCDLDASLETGTLKVILEYLQERHG